MRALWITYKPENMASRRTCELVGARYVETIRVPKSHEMYAAGFRHLRRYRIDARTLALPLPDER